MQEGGCCACVLVTYPDIPLIHVSTLTTKGSAFNTVINALKLVKGYLQNYTLTVIMHPEKVRSIFKQLLLLLMDPEVWTVDEQDVRELNLSCEVTIYQY